MMAALGSGLERASQTLREIVRAARENFAGPVTYAAAPWETVDWDLFDLVSVDAYRDAGNAAGYRDALRAYRRFGKPVAVTEFGCCTYRGAADRGGMGWMIVRRLRPRPAMTVGKRPVPTPAPSALTCTDSSSGAPRN